MSCAEMLCRLCLGDKKMMTVCCTCQKVKTSGRWYAEKLPLKKKISHGYCPDCFKQIHIKLDKYIQAKKELLMLNKKMKKRKEEDRRQQSRKQFGPIRDDRRKQTDKD